MWKFKLRATMTLIPRCRGDNYVAKALAEGLKLPVWLGSLGTFLASMLRPVAGAISGFINSVIYGPWTLSPLSNPQA